METVLCFDSGIGGLAYWRPLRELRPLQGVRPLRGVRWIYLADNAYFPFGEKQQGALCERICRVIGRALRHCPARFVILLCNTATVIALDELRRHFPHQQFIGTVPAIKPAAASSQRRKIVMLASRSTSEAAYVAQLHRQFAADCELTAINAASLIDFIEQDWLADDSAALGVERAIAPFVPPVLASGADQVVLGCTHFLHLKEALLAQLQAADPALQVCDSVAGIRGRLEYLLQQHLPAKAHQSTLPPSEPDLLLLTQKATHIACDRWHYWAETLKLDLQYLGVPQ